MTYQYHKAAECPSPSSTVVENSDSDIPCRHFPPTPISALLLNRICPQAGPPPSLLMPLAIPACHSHEAYCTVRVQPSKQRTRTRAHARRAFQLFAFLQEHRVPYLGKP